MLACHSNQYVEELSKLQQLREAVKVDVPVELLQHIDEGGNPDVFTSDLFKRSLRANQLSKGKVEAFRTFRCILVCLFRLAVLLCSASPASSVLLFYTVVHT